MRSICSIMDIICNRKCIRGTTLTPLYTPGQVTLGVMCVRGIWGIKRVLWGVGSSRDCELLGFLCLLIGLPGFS